MRVLAPKHEKKIPGIMKMFKLLAAGTLAAGMTVGAYASQSSPAVVINVVGSTAFRNAVTSAEVLAASNVGANLSGGIALGSFTTAGKSFSTTTGASGATQSNVYGYLADGSEVMYRNFWTGSLAGVIDLTQGNTTTDLFIPTSATMTATTGGSGGGTQFTGTLVTAVPNVAMSDVSASDGANTVNTAPGAGPSIATAIGASSLADGGATAGANHTVGVVTFQWVAGKQTSGTPPFSNISQQQAAALMASGAGMIPLSILDGVKTDDTNYVLFVGRNEDSGTRITYDAETLGGGIGSGAAFGPSTQQFMIHQTTNGYITTNTASVSVDATGINGFKLWTKNWALNTESTLNWNTIGHSGYTAGGDVANILSSPNPVSTSGWTVANAAPGFTVGTSTAYIVSCLGTSDAATAITAGAFGLSYNGVPFSIAAVEEGQYSLWGYEHLYYLTSATGTQSAVSGGSGVNTTQDAADALADKIFSLPTSTGTVHLSPVGVNFNDLDCVRGQTTGLLIN
jgi:hypothetical protein